MSDQQTTTRKTIRHTNIKKVLACRLQAKSNLLISVVYVGKVNLIENNSWVGFYWGVAREGCGPAMRILAMKSRCPELEIPPKHLYFQLRYRKSTDLRLPGGLL